MSEHDGSNGAVAVVDGGTVAAVRPSELLPPEAAWRQMRAMADDLFASGLMPPGIKSAAATLALMAKGRELGIPAMSAIEGISIIQGKPTCSPHLMLALVKRDHGPGAMRVAESTAERCVVEWRQPGWPGTQTYAFTIEDAKRADLLKNPTWGKYPSAMLRARCISAVAKMAFPESVGGMYVHGEIGGTPDAPPDETPPMEIVGDVVDVVAHEVPGPGPRDPEARRFAREIAEADTPAALKAVAGRLHEWGGADDALRDAYRARMAALVPPTARDDGDAEGGPRPGGITKPQMGKIWAIARQKLGDAADEALHAMASQTHGLGLDPTLWDLSKADASEVIEYLSDTDEQTLRADLGPVVFDWREKQRRAGENPPPGEPPPVATEDAGHEAAFAAVMDGMPGAEEPARDWGA